MPATMIDVDEAAERLPALLERALNGEVIVLVTRGQPLAKLMPLRPAKKKRDIGFAKFSLEANFDERIMARMKLEWHN